MSTGFDPGFAEFALEVSKPDPDLARAALLIARVGNPQLDLPHWLERLDALAEGARPHVALCSDPADQLDALLAFLCSDYGLKGNREAYYDPRNSFLDQVLERRLGIPITLALVVIEVGRRVGVTVKGVGFPGHFLIRGPAGRILDPFDGGAVLDRTQLAGMLGQGELDDALLCTCSKRELLARMLRNLKGVFVRRREVAQAIAVINRLLLVITDQSAEIRDRGLLYYGAGIYDRAATDLNYYLAYSQDPSDRAAVGATLRKISQRLNLQN